MTLFGDISGRLNATAETLLDSYEDGDMAEYDLVANTADATFVSNSGWEVDGTDVIQVDGGTAESQFYSGPTNGGLPEYYAKGSGETLRVYNAIDSAGSLSNTDFRLSFGIDESNTANRFDIRLEYFNDAVSVLEKGGAGTLASASSVGFAVGTQYRVDATWKSTDAIDVVVYDETNGAQVTSFTDVATSGTYGTQEGVGFSSYTGSATYTDKLVKV